MITKEQQQLLPNFYLICDVIANYLGKNKIEYSYTDDILNFSDIMADVVEKRNGYSSLTFDLMAEDESSYDETISKGLEEIIITEKYRIADKIIAFDEGIDNHEERQEIFSNMKLKFKFYTQKLLALPYDSNQFFCKGVIIHNIIGVQSFGGLGCTTSFRCKIYKDDHVL